MKDIEKLYVDKRVSKNGKEYYGIFAVINKVEILVAFVNKKQYDELSK